MSHISLTVCVVCWQEIIHWKLLFTWSPSEGVKVLQMDLLPRCKCEKPPKTS